MINVRANDENEKRVEYLQTRLDEVQETASALASGKEAARTKVLTLEAEVVQLSESSAEKEAALESVKKSAGEEKAAAAIKERSLEALLVKSEAQLVELQAALATTRQEAENQVGTLRDKLSTVRDGAAARVAALQREVKDRSESSARVSAKLEVSGSRIKELEARIEEAKTQDAQMFEDLKVMTISNDENEERAKCLQVQLVELQGTVGELAAGKEEASVMVVSLEEEIAKLSESGQQVAAALQAANEEVHELQRELEEAREVCAELRASAALISRKEVALAKALASSAEVRLDLKSQLAETSQQLAAMTEKSLVLEESNAIAGGADSDGNLKDLVAVGTLQAEIGDLTEALSMERAASKQREDALESALNSSAEKCFTLTMRLATTSSRLEALESTLEDVETSHEAWEASAVEDHTVLVQTLRREIASLKEGARGDSDPTKSFDMAPWSPRTAPLAPSSTGFAAELAAAETRHAAAVGALGNQSSPAGAASPPPPSGSRGLFSELSFTVADKEMRGTHKARWLSDQIAALVAHSEETAKLDEQLAARETAAATEHAAAREALAEAHGHEVAGGKAQAEAVARRAAEATALAAQHAEALEKVRASHEGAVKESRAKHAAALAALAETSLDHSASLSFPRPGTSFASSLRESSGDLAAAHEALKREFATTVAKLEFELAAAEGREAELAEGHLQELADLAWDHEASIDLVVSMQAGGGGGELQVRFFLCLSID